MNLKTAETLGYQCPFCGADCSPIAGTPCAHFFLTDGENGWRFTEATRALFDAASAKDPTVFRELLYHDDACRMHLRLLRSEYNDAIEVYVFSGDAAATIAAFEGGIAAV